MAYGSGMGEHTFDHPNRLGIQLSRLEDEVAATRAALAALHSQSRLVLEELQSALEGQRLRLPVEQLDPPVR